ncbi:SdrD B-like domain-containing protein [Streptomyces sp. NRRL F-4489]|uniref:SdrD B-like domain-containing protein n=1 Tax=Streptomyces sp. NRRL F-4489 TaxID=1609095 RepID=UPI001F3ABA2F|nr:SdrD B-like domain-containing protein [Streptomyces sp. NRRL F-4489]
MVTGSCSMAAAPAAFPQTNDGTVTVRVVRAVDTNGVWSPALEPGIGGVTVTLTNDDGVGITGVTAADGTVTLAPGKARTPSGKYRVQVVNPEPGVLAPAFASRKGLDGAPDQLSSNEEFVDLGDGKHVTYTTGLWNPGDYCQKNAPLATACQPATQEPPSQRTLVTFPYHARGLNTQTTDLATNAETGTLYGIAWSKPGKRLFSSAMAKRDTTYGPGGAGAIYVTDMARRTTSLFTTVPDAGGAVHGNGRTDDAFLAAAGKESLGDLDVSEDGRYLYAVNLNNRKLYRYDATGATARAPQAVHAIPDPGCPAAGDWRPFGLGFQDGTGYVGGVCSGQSTGKTADLRAFVLPFDPMTGKFGRAVLDQPLDYPRKPTLGGSCPGAGWFPWTDTFPTRQNGQNCAGAMANPEPELADIGFETDGSMLLAFRDRFTDKATAFPRPGDNTTYLQVVSGGDLNKACLSHGSYVMDTNTGCGMAPRGTRFFNVMSMGGGHPNSAYAGMALSKVEDSIATAGVDPIDTAYGAGTMFTKRDGTRVPGDGLRLNPANTVSSFGKGASMGDLEVLCDQAPLQIGNRVWYDPERTGVQGPGQRPVPGATVNLYDANGKLLATTKTTARGEYYFDDTNVPGGLKPRTKYTIRIDHPADYAPGGPLYQWVPTDEGVGGNRFVDSKGIVPKGGRFPERTLTTGGPGRNDHTFDFGFRQQEGAVRLVKHDQDGKPLAGAKFVLWKETNGTEGLQTSGAKPDTKAGSPCTTAADGICRIAAPPGTYYWQEVSPPRGYAAPENPVFGPLTLKADNLTAGVSATAVNRLLPTPAPPANPPTSPDTPAGPNGPGGHGGSPGSALPHTGVSQVAPMTLAAAGLTALGGALLAVGRGYRARHR